MLDIFSIMGGEGEVVRGFLGGGVGVGGGEIINR